MKKHFIIVVVFLSLCKFAVGKSSYLISAPNLIRPGMNYGMAVSILTSNGNVKITASLISKSTNVILSSTSGTFSQGNANSQLYLNIPKNVTTGQYAIKVRGSGGLSFSRQTNVACRENDILILIQTDKAIYSENQRVRFRVATMSPTLKPYTGYMDIQLYDSKNTLIQQWMAVNSGDGVFATTFLINADPNLGDWKIKVTAKGKARAKTISVKRYVLPKFNVQVNVGNNYILNSGPLVANINASYTFGQPVHGTAVVQFIKYPGKTVIKEKHIDVHGKGKTSLASKEIPSSAKEIVVVAQVGETTTGTTVIGSTTVNIVKSFTFTFGPTRKAFSPGLQYTTFVKISSAVGSKVLPTDKLSVRITITTVKVKRCKVYYPYDYKVFSSTSYTKSIVVGSNANPKLTFSTPNSATKITIVVTLRGVSEVLTVNADHTKSGKHIQIIPSAPSAQVGMGYRVDVKLSHDLDADLVYQIISRGVQIKSATVSRNGMKTIPLTFKVNSAFVPKAHVLVYTVYNGEIIADEIDIDVSGTPSLQKIQLNFEKQIAKPGERIVLKVQGSPNSKVYVLAVDESVNILQSGYDLSVADVIQRLQQFDYIPPGYTGKKIYRRANVQGEQNTRSERNVLSEDINDADDIFRISGMDILSDAALFDYDASRISSLKTFCKENKPKPGFRGNCPNCLRPNSAFIMKPLFMPTNSIGSVKPNFRIHNKQKVVQKVLTKIAPMNHAYTRKHFPEAWIWESVNLGNAGSKSLLKTIPDTITTWRTSAFGLGGGFGITDTVAKDQGFHSNLKLAVYKPLFVDVILPFKVVRGEKVAIKVSVYNYQPRNVTLLLTVSHTADPQKMESHSAQVRSGASSLEYFQLDAKKSGMSNVTVIVRDLNTFMVVDRIQKQMKIKNEGIEKEYNRQYLISVSNGMTFTEKFTVTLPGGYVTGSKRVYVTVSGDVTAPTIAGLGHLIRRPTGCGEQTIMYLAPNIFVTQYLKVTKQLTQTFKQKAIENMIYGRDNELRWQRRDGSFSAWGNSDRSGSMWITAFVALSFHQAKQFIHIDKSILTRAVDWIIRYQNSDGSFREPGRVIHANMQGGSISNRVAFTAYVMVALLEIDDIPEYKNKITASKNRAKRYIENKASSITGDHALALCSYALKMAGSSRADFVFKKLIKRAIDKDQMRCWDSNLRNKKSAGWSSPNPRARPIDIETAAYALLYYVLDKDFGGGMKVLRWLTSQRNPTGGFASTQDTVVSLHAMAEFSAFLFVNKGSPSKDRVNVDIDAGSQQSMFLVQSSNRLQLQRADLPDTTKHVSIRATGRGLALVDVVVVYNIRKCTGKAAYTVTTKIVKESFDSIKVGVCSRRTKSGNSGMVVQEITLPSGFKADLTSIRNVNGLKQKEADLDKVVLYFDSVGSSQVCVNMKAERVDKVIQSQTYPVEIYDYYDPRNQGIGNYTSGVLKNLKLCEVCPDCYVCTYNPIWG